MKKITPATKEIIHSITCDVCGTKYTETWDIQEFLSFKDTGGYGSIIGDGVSWEIDICQGCVKSVLGRYLRITEANG